MVELMTALNLEGTFNSSMQKELIGVYLVYQASLMRVEHGEIKQRRSRIARGSS